MGENYTAEAESTPARRPRPAEDDEEEAAAPDVHDVGAKIARAQEAYNNAYGAGNCVERPSKGAVLSWYLYGMCSYFIHTVLIPIVFTLIVSHTIPAPPQEGMMEYRNSGCSQREVQLYSTITYKAININNVKFSPLLWTALSWAIGLILAAPLLGVLSIHLDFGRNQQLIAAIATGIGAAFCLPAGFFKTRWIFPPYIAAIVAANTVANAAHSRQLGLMVRGIVGTTVSKTNFRDRRSVASWLSLHATAAGCVGAAVIAAFTYHMLRKSDSFTSLWVVSIFSGVIWFLGIVHILTTNQAGSDVNLRLNPVPMSHVTSIFQYPHAAGSLAGVFLSSFTTMCIFTGAVLYAIGNLCIKPTKLLYSWLMYFLFSVISLPLSHPLQQLVKADAVKMQLLGFLLSAITAGFGFYYRHEKWRYIHLLLFAAIQSTATGYLHAYGRILLLDCSPVGKEGAFSVWFSWIRALGTCAGFALASAFPGNIGRPLGVAFCTAVLGKIILVFGNISSFGGAKAAGIVREHSERGSPVAGFDSAAIDVAAPPQGGRIIEV